MGLNKSTKALVIFKLMRNIRKAIFTQLCANFYKNYANRSIKLVTVEVYSTCMTKFC